MTSQCCVCRQPVWTAVPKEVTISTIGYVRDPSAATREQGYRTTEAISSRAEWAEATLDAEYRRLAAMVDRYRIVAASVGLSGAAEKRLRGLLR